MHKYFSICKTLYSPLDSVARTFSSIFLLAVQIVTLLVGVHLQKSITRACYIANCISNIFKYNFIKKKQIYSVIFIKHK